MSSALVEHNDPLWPEIERRGALKRAGVLNAASIPSPGQFVADPPDAIWQIDHTVIDIVAVDEHYRRPIGLPVLTIAIDVCT